MVKHVDFLELDRTDPLRSLRLQFFPDKRLATILVRGIVNDAQNIRDITRAIAMNGGRVMIMRPSNPAGRIVDVLYVIECPRGLEDRIASKIEELGRAREVLVVDMPDEKLALNVLFPYMVMGGRGIVITESILRGFFAGIRERLGEDGAQAFLYLIGLDMGGEVYEAIKILLLERSLESSIKLLGCIMRSLGVCRLKSVRIEEGRIEVEILDNIEAAVVGKGYRSPQCHNIRGVFAGFLNKLTDRRWRVEEVECEAMGSDRCRLLMKPHD
ncbi:MAG: hypothetical protein J7L17_03095 [Thaumarchaeota archaeon]|nr:hypothetical protein [Nitrososphaerota archaeon]